MLTTTEIAVVEWEGQPVGEEVGGKPVSPTPAHACRCRLEMRDQVAEVEEIMGDVATLQGEMVFHCLGSLCDLVKEVVKERDATVRILTVTGSLGRRTEASFFPVGASRACLPTTNYQAPDIRAGGVSAALQCFRSGEFPVGFRDLLPSCGHPRRVASNDVAAYLSGEAKLWWWTQVVLPIDFEPILPWLELKEKIR